MSHNVQSRPQPWKRTPLSDAADEVWPDRVRAHRAAGARAAIGRRHRGSAVSMRTEGSKVREQVLLDGPKKSIQFTPGRKDP